VLIEFNLKGQRCVGGLKKKDEVFELRSLEDVPYSYLVGYLKREEPMYFLGQRKVLSRFQALRFETFYSCGHILMVVQT